MRIEFNLRHNVQYSIVFERFSVNSRKRIKTVVWTGSDRCVLDNNENAKFWKRISVDGTYRFYCQFSSWRGWVCLLSGGRGAEEDGRPGVWLSLIRCSKTQLLNDVSWLYSSLSLARLSENAILETTLLLLCSKTGMKRLLSVRQRSSPNLSVSFLNLNVQPNLFFKKSIDYHIYNTT